jgi:2-polyprenyl-3-methyl-5-hydroxy-6-metoxy-1,4-benzoquinol methylase
LPDRDIKILDVGPGRGVYNALLKKAGYLHIDAVEKYRPYIEKFNMLDIYDMVFNKNVTKFKYDYYDLVIFGDVLEHLKIKDAKRVIHYAQEHSKLIIVAVPYCDYQIGQQLDGSGDHRQYDLTRNVFLERYEGFKLLINNEKTGVFYSIRD